MANYYWITYLFDLRITEPKNCLEFQEHSLAVRKIGDINTA